LKAYPCSMCKIVNRITRNKGADGKEGKGMALLFL
jgi:hypothetical protein